MQDFDSYIAAVLEKWLEDLNHKLQAAILAENLVDTGDLYRSLRSKVSKNVLGMTAHGQLDMKLYGRFLDMKRPNGIPANTNAINRAVVGVARNRGRSFYNKTVYKSKFELADMLLKDIGKMSKKEFLNWVKS
jgi:hypothetical protein